MYEKECDSVLSILDKHYGLLNYTQNDLLAKLAKEIGDNEAAKCIEAIISILITNNHIQNAKVGNSGFILTHQGKAFISTTSYTQQKHEWELLKALKDKEVLKLEQDLKMNSWLLKYKWLPHIISLIGIIISIIALYNSVNKTDSQYNKEKKHQNAIDTTIKDM